MKTYQSMFLLPLAAKILLHWLKWRFSNQYPLLALKGEGCPEVKMWCFVASIKACFFFANPPHSKNTTPSFLSDSFLITASVKVSQPFPWWLPASCARTVSVAFNNNTP